RYKGSLIEGAGEPYREEIQRLTETNLLWVSLGISDTPGVRPRRYLGTSGALQDLAVARFLRLRETGNPSTLTL
ncbi:hypothetical protein ACFWZ7_26235, partial [Nocardiopsis alba]|uniref:hypothetical protein n=1 Tax=Nocardiopsis alba TaxID=53437 RepID=UPI003670D657